MKMHLFLFTLILLILASCNETTVEPKEPINEDTTHKYPDCPFYDASKFIGPRCDKIISVSYDGKYSSLDKYNLGSQLLTNRWLLNNLTGEYFLIGGEQQYFDFDSTIFTQFRLIRLDFYFEFSPYNSNLLVFSATTLVDTIGDKKVFIPRMNLFTYNIETKILQLITPNAFGKGGAIYKNPQGMKVKWLPESKISNDVFYIRYGDENYKYFLQTDRLEIMNIQSYSAISNNLNLLFSIYPNSNTSQYYTVNNKELYLYDTLEHRASKFPVISFDNKYILMQVISKKELVDTSQNPRHIELWVIDVDKWLASIGEFKDFTKINTRFQHCLYMVDYHPNFNSQVAFTPQNTLLVSMHPSNSPQGNVYEMDLKGNIIRKITNN